MEDQVVYVRLRSRCGIHWQYFAQSPCAARCLAAGGLLAAVGAAGVAGAALYRWSHWISAGGHGVDTPICAGELEQAVIGFMYFSAAVLMGAAARCSIRWGGRRWPPPAASL